MDLVGLKAGMDRRKVLGLILILTLGLSSCASPGDTSLQTAAEPTLTPEPDPPATQVVQVTSTPIPQPSPGDPASFPLAERGPYWTGNRVYTLADPHRSGREIRITIHYPASIEFNAEGNPITRDAAPDLSGAPYPVILTGPNSGDLLFKSHLASQGFVMVIVRPPQFHYEDPWDLIVVDGPLDFLFILEQLGSSPPEGLAGMMDTERVGVAGYSWDGFFSLTLSGAQIDPEHYTSVCTQASSANSSYDPGKFDLYCGLIDKWEEFQAYADEMAITNSEGLWEPLTDGRILAAMPMAPDGAWLYGERGVAGIQIPTLIITGSADEMCSYLSETVFIFEHLGSPERYLISFINMGHMMVFNAEVQLQMNHFAAAFFGYYLQGREDYVQYFSEDFVNAFADLAWGVYPK